MSYLRMLVKKIHGVVIFINCNGCTFDKFWNLTNFQTHKILNMQIPSTDHPKFDAHGAITCNKQEYQKEIKQSEVYTVILC